jgi:hypothetical protein
MVSYRFCRFGLHSGFETTFHAENAEENREARREHRNSSAPHQFLRVLRVRFFVFVCLHNEMGEMKDNA